MAKNANISTPYTHNTYALTYNIYKSHTHPFINTYINHTIHIHAYMYTITHTETHTK